MTEAGDGPLDQLAEGLSSEQRSEFFQALHQAGISPQDVELARLLRSLQLYKAFYEEIPARVSQALKEADTWSTRIRSLHESMAARLESALTQLERNTEAAAGISKQFREARTLLAAAINKSVNDVVPSLESAVQKLLTAMLLEPLESSLDDLKDQWDRTATEAKKISSQIKLARRIHVAGYALAAGVIALTVTLTVWFNLARRYSSREQELIQQIDQNSQVLSELARQRAVLEVQRDPADSRKLYLLMKPAKTWTTDKHLIVEVK